jgi:flagellar motor switch protein FliG
MESQSLAGAQRAAAILLALGKDAATQVLRHFSPEELREVTVAAARLGAVPVGELESLVEQFTADFAEGASVLGDEGHARALLADAASPDQISDFLSAAGADGPPNVWQATAALPDPALAAFLKDEHALTATYVLSRLDAAQSARVVALLPRDLRNQVLCRLIAPPVISPAALAVLENALREALVGGSAKPGGDESRIRIAEIINGLDAGDAADVMQMLETARPADARVVRTMLFSFNDLPRLTQRARALLFDKLSTDLVVLALRGTEAEFGEPALSAMASRSRRLVESELANPSSAPVAETTKARKEIVNLVLMMSRAGEIELPSSESAAADAA